MQTVMIALAAFASAVPYAGRGHAHGHQLHNINHHVQVAHDISIAGRSISYDGSCGSWSGATCPAGFCCGYVIGGVLLLELVILAETLHLIVPSAGVVTLPSTAASAARLDSVIAVLNLRPRLTSTPNPALRNLLRFRLHHRPLVF